MNKKEIKLAVDMLNELSEILSWNGCNEWEFPDDWTLKEKQAFTKEYYELNNEPKEFENMKDNPRMDDLCVAELLAYKLSLKGGYYD